MRLRKKKKQGQCADNDQIICKARDCPFLDIRPARSERTGQPTWGEDDTTWCVLLDKQTDEVDKDTCVAATL